MTAPRSTEESRTLIDRLLDEQRLVTAVARFAQRHEDARSPLLERHYRALVPMDKPRPGQQYAFEVDLDRCSGCKACVTACHSLNGLDERESWRATGLLIGGADGPGAASQTVTSACHHCLEPGCADGCPVLAYEKDPATGIVRHLDDQCIGCQYCVMKCPYEVPQYSKSRGIVRKCDMCHQRLAAGEAPACAQACPTEAIRITVVGAPEIRLSLSVAGANPFLPATPSPAITFPTTRYTSKRTLSSDLRAADESNVTPAHAHWPLVFMLALTQASVGLFSLAPGVAEGRAKSAALGLAWALGMAGLGVSVLHLGRPLKAWRAFLGLRRSWLSREIVIFGLFAKLATAWTATALFPNLGLPEFLNATLPAAAIVTGWLGVVCSVMVYHDTGRVWWGAGHTGPRFVGSACAAGLAGAAVFAPAMAIPALAAVWLKAALEWSTLRHARGSLGNPATRSATLLLGPLRPWIIARTLLAGAGSALLPFPRMAAAGFALVLAGEIAERLLFFRAISQPAMPGGAPA
jgi:formate dehydrogenase iron-sulfur subunit